MSMNICSICSVSEAYLEEGDEVGLWGGLELSLQPSGELLRLNLSVLKETHNTRSDPFKPDQTCLNQYKN